MRNGLRLAAVASSAVVMSCAVVLTGCAGGQKPNAEQSSGATATTSDTTTTTTPPPAIVSPSALDPGRFPTQPRPPLGTAGSPERGAVVDAQHLADYVVGPWEVDEAITSPYLSTTFLLGNAGGLEQLGPTQLSEAAGRHRMVNGFASARQAEGKSVLVNAVLRFPDPEAAKAAAADMNIAATQVRIQGETPLPTDIPAHADTLATTYPFTPSGAPVPWAAVRAFTPHGPYVTMQVAQSAEGVDGAKGLAAKAIDAQLPRIDGFAPAPADALAGVPVDPTGLLARTLPGGEDTAATKNAVYGRAGALHFQSNPSGSSDLFKDNGVDAVAMAATNVYQARDEAAAARVADAFGVEVDTQGVTPADPVPGLPASRCLTFPSGFYCVAPAARYAIEVQGADLPTVHQQVAAQYVTLTAR